MIRFTLALLAFFLAAFVVSQFRQPPTKEDCREFDYQSSHGPCRMLWCKPTSVKSLILV